MVIVIAGVVVLIGLTAAVLVDGGPLPGELSIVSWWQSLGTPVPEIAEFVRATTSTEASIVAALPAVWWLAREHGRRTALHAFAVALVSMLAVQPISKELIDRPRPTVDQVDVRAEHTSKSYPSGHSLSTTTTWGAAALYAARTRRRPLAAAFAIPVAVTGMSSSIQGVHWPSDAMAGTIMGAFAAWVIVRVVLRSAHQRD